MKQKEIISWTLVIIIMITISTGLIIMVGVNPLIGAMIVTIGLLITVISAGS